jgi:hypothetical protein
VFDPLHYLALIEQKINALDQAAPLAGWQLPEQFATLRRLLEVRMGKQGKREYVQVLRLLEAFKIEDMTAAVREAIARGAIGFENNTSTCYRAGQFRSTLEGTRACALPVHSLVPHSCLRCACTSTCLGPGTKLGTFGDETYFEQTCPG